MINRVLQGRYRIQRQLGERHDRETWLALDQTSDRPVVVKLLLFNRDLKWDMFKLFEREAKILKELSHPAIPHYIDYFDVEIESGKGFAFVQSYIDAPSLAEHIKAGRTFSETDLRQIAKSILEVLTYLHGRNPPIIHRDIKPSNILLDNRSGNHVGDIYLVDFGAVQAAVNSGGTRTVVGTYGYMAPEQFGERAVPASDLYGLGTTLIYLASGQHPADLPQKDLQICIEDHVHLSPPLMDWLKWITEPSLEKRLESAHHALQVLDAETVRQKSSLTPQQKLFLAPVKPYDSKVVLAKAKDLLEIYIPLEGFSLELVPTIVFAVIWYSFLWMWYSTALASFGSGGWFMACFDLLHLGVGIGLIVKILFALFGQVYVRLDQKEIALKYKLFGLKYSRPRPAPRQQVLKLERTQSTYVVGYKGRRKEVKPQVNIWVGKKKFEIGGDGLLSEVELDWIASEIGDWLGLPVIQ